MRSLSLLLAAAALSLGASAAFAQSEPADSMIKGALYDIERAEQQLPSLTPSRAANIKRMQRTLKMTEERLASSPNQSDPSWREASQRLQALNQALADLVGGGTATAPEPPAQTQPAQAATPDQQPATAGPTDTSTLTVKPAPTETAGPDPEIDRARRELDMIAGQVRNMREGDAKLANRFLKDLGRIQDNLVANADRAHADWSGIVTYHGDVKATLNAHVVVALSSDLMSVAGNIDQMQPLQYLAANDVSAVRNGLVEIATSAVNLGAPDQAQVKDLIGRIQRVSAAFEERVAAAEASQATLGDVPARIKEIEQRTYGLEVPDALIQAPLTEQAISAYAEQMKASQGHIADDAAYLDTIAGKTPMTVDEGNRFRRLQSVLNHEKAQDIAESLEQTTFAVDASAEEIKWTLDYANETDPNNGDHRTNRLLGEGRFEETMRKLEQAIASVKIASIYDSQMSRTDAPDRTAQVATLEEAMTTFAEKRHVALTGIRMPEAISTDEEMLAAAAEVLANQDNAPAYDRMVITYGPKHREKTTGNINARATSSTTTTATVSLYDFSWDEFRTTTAEKVGDKYYLFINSFRYYYSGGDTTILDEWILYDRFQTDEILAENIDK